MTKPEFAVVECAHSKALECTHLDFTQSGKTVVGFDISGTVTFWDADTGKVVRSKVIAKDDKPNHHWVSPDQRTFALSGNERTLLVDIDKLTVITTLPTDASAIAWSVDEKLMVIGDHDGNVSVMAGTGKRPTAVLKLGEFAYVPHIAFVEGGSEIAFYKNEPAVFTWNYRTKSVKRRVPLRNQAGPWNCASSPGAKIWVSVGEDGWLIKTDMTTWKSTKSRVSFPGKFRTFTVSSDGTKAAIGAGSTLLVWDLAEDSLWLKWKKPNFHDLQAVAFSPDGQRIACILDYRVHILDFRSGATEKLIGMPKPKSGEQQCLNMVGPDDRMDQDDWDPLNPLTVKCDACKAVDLNSVSTPYVLARKIESPVDMAPAIAGNLLVRDSMKQVLDVVVPGQCRFYPTVNRKTKQPTSWLLAVPQHIQTTATPKGKTCSKCGEPLDWESGEETESPFSTRDVFKSRNLRWGEREHYLYFSVRLETLVTKVGLRGMVRSYDCKQVPTPEDVTWVEEKLRLLKQAGSQSAGAGKTDAAKDWFKDYLKKNAKKNPAVHDFVAFEKKHGIKLPESYKEFLAAVGTKSYKEIDEEEGFCVHILPPKKLAVEECCERDAEDEASFKGVMFATTDHGDAFYFAVSSKASDYEVRKNDHELDSFEPYAKNFAAAIRRFAGG